MRITVLGFMLTLIFLNVNGQKDSSFFKTGSASTNKIHFTESQDHFMINLTMDNLMANSTDTFFNSKVFNPNVGFYFMYDFPIGKSGLSVAPGLGFTFSKTNLSNSILSQDSLGTSFLSSKNNALFKNSTKTYGSSSVYTSWVEVPVELRYRTKPLNGRSSLKFAVGMRFGMRLGSNSTVSYNDPKLSREVEIKETPFSDLNSLRYGMTFRVGYGALNLFGYYGLNQFIKTSKNYNNLDLRQYSIGISITGL